MKRSYVVIMVLLLLAMGASIFYSQSGKPEQTADAVAAARQPVSEQEQKQAFSYAIGYQLGRQLAAESGDIRFSDIDPESLYKALAKGLSGQALDINSAQTSAALASFAEVVRKRENAKATANAQAGKAFLEENAKEEGVVTTKSGLQYKVISKGEGRKYDAAKDGKDALCSVTYEGKLIDGTVFDKAEQPVQMPIGRVVPGFSEALSLMPVGSEWELAIPSELAYGEQAPAPLGPNATLIFKLKLLDIQAAPQPQAQDGAEQAPAPEPAPEAPANAE